MGIHKVADLGIGTGIKAMAGYVMVGLLVILLVMQSTFAECKNIPKVMESALCVILRSLEGIAGIIAALLLTFAGLRWMMSEDPEIRSRTKAMAGHVIVGLIIIIVAVQLITTLIGAAGSPFTFDCGTGAAEISERIRPIICVVLRMLQGIAAIIAAIALLLSGIQFISSDDPETRSRAKGRAVQVIVGLLIVIIAVQLVTSIVSGTRVTDTGCAFAEITEATTITGILCKIFRVFQALAIIVATLFFAIGGLIWLGSEDVEGRQRAKSMIIKAIGGVIITLIVLQLLTNIISNAGLGTLSCAEVIPPEIKTPINYLGCLLYRIILILGIIATTVIIILAGFRWMGPVMIAGRVRWGGSEDVHERTNAKNMLIQAIIGLLVVILAVTVIGAFFENEPALNFLNFDCSGQGLEADILGPMQYVGCVLIKVLQGGVAVVAIIVLLISGLKWISTESIEDRIAAREMIKHALLGLLIAGLALQITQALLGGLASLSPITDCDLPMVMGIKTGINYYGCTLVRIFEATAALLAGLTVVMLGIKWMIGTEDPEERAYVKRTMGYVVVGLLIMIVALQLVNALVNHLNVTEFTLTCGVPVAIRNSVFSVGCYLIRLIQMIAGLAAAVVIIISGIRWMSSENPMDRNSARSWMIAAIIGMVIIFVGMQFVNWLITGSGLTSVTC